MPAPGDQHKASTTSANPFEEVKHHINEYTAQEVATLQSRLEKQLGPEYISSRPGAGGGKVHYLAAEKCINLANEVFGFNGWSSGIRDVTVDFIDESQSTGKISLGLSVIVRVTLRDGTYHEDIGYGHIENCKGKAAAFEKAKKEGTTDALKRALRNFGNILGNCIYDKDYLARVTKLKIAPSKWDAEHLHRHSDYAPVKKESLADVEESRISAAESCSTVKESEDEFGGLDFDEVDFSVPNGDHPDEVVLDTTVSFAHHSRRISPTNYAQNFAQQRPNGQAPSQSRPPAPRVQSIPVSAMNEPTTPNAMMAPATNGHQMAKNPGNGQYSNGGMVQRHQQPLQQMNNQNRPQGMSSHVQLPGAPASFNPNIGPPPQQGAVLTRAGPPSNTPPSKPSGSAEIDPPVGFFTARAAECLQNASGLPPNVPLFNPHAESPSIRKTAGVDHTKTKPVVRDSIAAPAATSVNQSLPPARMNFVNPQTDQTRRIGMPGTGSPMQNRNSYKPPQMMKRPADAQPAQFSRPVLNDVTSVSANMLMDTGGGDHKRVKVEANNTSGLTR